jgi:hypothetical protein
VTRQGHADLGQGVGDVEQSLGSVGGVPGTIDEGLRVRDRVMGLGEVSRSGVGGTEDGHLDIAPGR